MTIKLTWLNAGLYSAHYVYLQKKRCHFRKINIWYRSGIIAQFTMFGDKSKTFFFKQYLL